VRVLDSSAAVKLLVGDGEVIELDNEELVAPHLIDSEVVNALRRLVIRRQLTDDEGAAALELFGALEIARYPADWLRGRMWALRGNFTGQDATYIALAEMLGNVPLLTADVHIRDAPVALNCPVELL
jgi:predicted nucleic acid-binding protein